MMSSMLRSQSFSAKEYTVGLWLCNDASDMTSFILLYYMYVS